MASEMLTERRKTASDSSDTASILSVASSSHRVDRRRTGECVLDSEERHAKEKRTTVDRMRRKTTDNVLTQSSLSTASSGSAKGQSVTHHRLGGLGSIAFNGRLQA